MGKQNGVNKGKKSYSACLAEVFSIDSNVIKQFVVFAKEGKRRKATAR